MASSLPFIADHRRWLATFDQQPVQFPCHADAGERGIGHQRQAFAGAVIDDRQDVEAAAVRELIRHKVERPAFVRRNQSTQGEFTRDKRFRIALLRSAFHSS